MSAFDIAKLPAVGELVIARMSGARNEPFGLGVVVAAPTLCSASSPPERSHTLTLQRKESIGGVVHAAAATPATSRGLTAAQLDDLPLTQLAALSCASFEVQVHWYDLESEWVTKLRLLDDEHWQSEYMRHKKADERVATRVGREPPSAGWIVAQYKAATFLPKPGEADEVQGILAVAALIVWGSPDALLTAAGQLTPTAFDTIWRDLVELPRGGKEVPVAAAAAAAAAAVAAAKACSDDESTALSRSSKKRLAPAAASARTLPVAAETKRHRTAAPRTAPSSAPSKNAAATGSAAAAAAPASSQGQCGSCERLQSELSEMAQDLEAVRRLITALATRAKFGTTR